jgi:hypothetical protein
MASRESHDLDRKKEADDPGREGGGIWNQPQGFPEIVS